MHRRLHWLCRHRKTPCTPRTFSTQFPFTNEQLEVIKWSRTHNCIVSARPGTGKTTVAEAIMAAYLDEPTVYVTFSRNLRNQADERIKLTMGAMSPHSVYTLHELAGVIFGTVVPNDSILQQCLRRGVIPTSVFPWRRIILDEAQDLTPPLFRLIYLLSRAITRESIHQPKILLIGDPKQAIYSFRNADSRFLTDGQAVFSSMSNHPWVNLDLTVCQRFAQETADFINEYIGESYIEGHDGGGKAPIYICTDVDKPKSFVKKVVELIRDNGGIENSAILVPSIRDKRLKTWDLINMLSEEHNIPIAITDRKWGSSDPETLQGKLLLSSYHGMKGEQRKFVVVLGADASYYRIYGSDYDLDQCPPPVFVAVTRSSEQLVVVQSHNSPAMPFTFWDGIKRTAAEFLNYTNQDPIPPAIPTEIIPSSQRYLSATNILDYMPEIDLDEAAQLLNIEKRKGRLPPITIPTKVRTIESKDGKDHYEPVEDINEMAMVADFEYFATKKCTLPTGRKAKRSIPDDSKAASRWFAEAAAKYNAKRSKYRFRLKQLQPISFDWLGDSLVQTRERLERRFRGPLSRLQFKSTLNAAISLPNELSASDRYRNSFIYVNGKVDVVDPGVKKGDRPTLWSLKHVPSLSLAHALELAIYGHLFCKLNRQFPHLVLYNVRDGEQWDISGTFKGTMEMLQRLLIAKERRKVKLTDEEFREQCREAIKEVDDQFYRMPQVNNLGHSS